MRENKGIFDNIDWITLGLYLVLVLMGWANIYAAVYSEEHQSITDLSQQYGKQMLFIASSLILGLLVLSIDGRLYDNLAYFLYGLTVVLLVLVLVAGKEVNGARSWFAIGGFTLQPSEFAKFSTALALARFLSTRGVTVLKWKYRWVALALFLVPGLIILPQPDAGSFLVYLAFFFVLFREGLPGIYLWMGFGAIVLFLLSLLVPQIWLLSGIAVIAALAIYFNRKKKGFWLGAAAVALVAAGVVTSVDYAFNNLLEDRHRNRINILLGKAHDPKGIGYNTTQSLIAIGSGGFMGKGFKQGTQTKFNFVPEQSTDFIFCTIGEEWGFVGSVVVVGLFVALLSRLVMMAERQKSAFSRIYGYGVISILFIHFFVNVAMALGLAPVIGIPLPFFSYGGSSLWGFTLLLFIFLRLDAYRMQIL
jgi:rod shape determining protein RodA